MEDGRSRFEVTVRREHMNPHGVVHGGERCATLEIKINYLAPVSEGRITAEAWMVARTARIAVLEARVQGDHDRLVAVGTGSFYIQTPR